MQRPYGRRRFLQPNKMHERFYGDFEYVVTEKIPPRVCFSSGLDRVCLPASGPCLTTFMRRYTGEVQPGLSPTSYDVKRDAFYDLQHRKTSKKGIGDRAPRWIVKQEYQPAPSEPPVVTIKQNCAPFNQTCKKKPFFTSNNNPAPCNYNPDPKKRNIKFAYSFGGKKVLRCVVEIKCVPYNLDECGVCGCSCSVQGDYWQFEDRLFLCRKHYNRLFKHCLSKFQGAILADFKSVRDCFFMHAHNSCKAALKIMKSEEIAKKLRKEAYLDLYFSQRRFCDR